MDRVVDLFGAICLVVLLAMCLFAPVWYVRARKEMDGTPTIENVETRS